MSRCTAPVRGHRTSSAAAACPACGSSGYRSYGQRSYPSPSYSPLGYSGGGQARVGASRWRSKPSWSPAGSTVVYTAAEVRTLEPVRENAVRRATKPDVRDIFLCHAWDDRKGAAKDLHELLEARGVSVWFSEQDVSLGSQLLREIDKGLAKSRIGIVLVTPVFLERIEGEGIAGRELSALLATDLLVPIVHNTTYEELRDVSPLLGSRSGLDTAEDLMVIVADKLAELVK